ncbi:MAG: PSD1 domain-containing protein [Planctomycetaceae bacterium]|nr:PSD1 domain-containing protein [Planctomycetaceae bacterium]
MKTIQIPIRQTMKILATGAVAIVLFIRVLTSIGHTETAEIITDGKQLSVTRESMLPVDTEPAATTQASPLLAMHQANAVVIPETTDITFSAEQIAYFEQQIRPVLVKHCYECHSDEAGVASGGLRVDTRSGLLKGGITGPAVVPENPAESLLLRAIRQSDPELSMPPAESGEKLPASIAAKFEQWIKMGAPDPRAGNVENAVYDTEAAKAWWAYQPVSSPPVPDTKNQSWPKTDLDRFILAALEQQGMQPVADAEKSSLLRRIYLDLTGLPPTPAEQERFLSSTDPQAFERLVDDLLSRPQFGERWGRHWLDVARYAETTGRDVNLTMPQAWRYRDYVIHSFNEDVPFDRFILEQIAGDLLKSSDEAERAMNLIATGFLAVGPKGLNETDPRQFAVELADEQIGAVSQAFLGMTISCARCHDHEFDPITQRDYTALAGIFLSTETHYGTPGGVRARNASDLVEIPSTAGLVAIGRIISSDEYAQKKRQLDQVEDRLSAALRARAPRNRQESDGNDAMAMSGFDIVRMMTRAQQLKSELAAFNSDGSPKPLVMAVSDKPVTLPQSARSGRRVGGPNSGSRTSSGFEIIADCPLFLRGSIESESDRVPRGLPEFLSGGDEILIPASSSGRLQLAEWIATPENSLTSRVIVNRVWHWLFGRGLVESVDNFGTSGTPPSNAALLDHLASEFVADGWSVKSLIRRIVLSRVYQLGSTHDPASYALDPDNKLLWRANARRLDAETIRDSILAASGQLQLTPEIGSPIARAGDGPLGGERFQAIREEEIVSVRGNFRSIYLPIARNVQPEALAVFDFADPSSVLGARETTIVPPQALYLLNGEFVDQQSQAMARRVMQEPDFNSRFELACQLAWCRDPFAEESRAARSLTGNDLPAWTSLCRALLSSADFLFVD